MNLSRHRFFYHRLFQLSLLQTSFPIFALCILYDIAMGLKPFLGLRGNALLRAALFLVVCPTFTCYGYNMSVAGGLLTLDAFNDQFPRMDTIHTSGALQQENSQIQGRPITAHIYTSLVLSDRQDLTRHRDCSFYRWWHLRRVIMRLLRRPLGPT